MKAIPIKIIRLELGTPEPSDRLCDTCHNPATVDFPVMVITDHGVGQVGVVTACVDCFEEDD